MNKEKINIFIDMDGTLAEFKKVDTLETLYEEGYFSSLKPLENVVDAVTKLNKDPNHDVFILSSVLTDSDYALTEKNEWLDRYLPEITRDRRFFPPCGMPKKEWLSFFGFEVGKDCILIDDYTKNLYEWNPPGLGIKLMNGINGTVGTWKGERIDHKDPNLYETIKESIENLTNKSLAPPFELNQIIEQRIAARQTAIAADIVNDKGIEI